MAAKDEMMLLGPAEAPIALIRGRYRYRLLAKGPKSADMQSFLRDLLSLAPKERNGVRVQIDVDPQNFM
jgi:primosomal protein N' (replication factor Y)